MNLRRSLLALAVGALAVVGFADGVGHTQSYVDPSPNQARPFINVDENGNHIGGPAHPEHVTCDSGCTSGSGGAVGVTSTQANATVTTHGTYQQALASNVSRKSCLIVNTSSDTLKVFFGATGSATSANGIPLPAGSWISCLSAPYVLTDNVAITSANTDGATYVVVSQ